MEDLSQFNRKVRIEKLFAAAFPLLRWQVPTEKRKIRWLRAGCAGGTRRQRRL
ncbi:MAG: hypothetical protein U1F27_03925 [Turneriella sp.]